MLDDSLRKAFVADGYAVVPNVLDSVEIARLSAGVVSLLESGSSCGVDAVQIQTQYGRRRTPILRRASQLTRTDPLFIELAHSAGIVDRVEALIGPGALLYRDVTIVKPPRTGRGFALHQDSAYWDVTPQSLVSVWLALTDAPHESGCLEVVPGSHRSLVPHGLMIRNRARVPTAITRTLRAAVSKAGTGDNPRQIGGSALWRLKRFVLSSATSMAPILGDLADFRVLPEDVPAAPKALPIRCGDAIFFHSLLMHGSGPNTSGQERIAAILSYAPAGATTSSANTADFEPARLG